MAAMIWDPALGAWQEAEAPQVWDPALGAYKDTTGLAWNPDKGAWEEVWAGRRYLYKDGNEYTAVTGGWHFTQIYQNCGTGTKYPGSIQVTVLHSPGGNTAAGIASGQKVSFAGYKWLKFRFRMPAERVCFFLDTRFKAGVGPGPWDGKWTGLYVNTDGLPPGCTMEASGDAEYVVSIDVSGYTQPYYIYEYGHVKASHYADEAFTFYETWLEK